MNQINFILTSGELTPQYRRAIRSAAVHDAPIVLFHAGDEPDVSGLDVTTEQLVAPRWLDNLAHAHRWDVLAYQVAYEHGGLMLGLDTISLCPALGLLDDDHDVIVSTDCPPGHQNPHPYNNILIARQHSDAIGEMYEEAERRARFDPEVWGYTGPLMLTQFVEGHERIAAAPFPALCGWEGSYIWRFYLGLETPSPDVRVIHLFSSAYRALYEGRPNDWAWDNPRFAGDVARRSSVNDQLLAA